MVSRISCSIKMLKKIIFSPFFGILIKKPKSPFACLLLKPLPNIWVSEDPENGKALNL